MDAYYQSRMVTLMIANAFHVELLDRMIRNQTWPPRFYRWLMLLRHQLLQLARRGIFFAPTNI